MSFYFAFCICICNCYFKQDKTAAKGGNYIRFVVRLKHLLSAAESLNRVKGILLGFVLLILSRASFKRRLSFAYCYPQKLSLFKILEFSHLYPQFLYCI